MSENQKKIWITGASSGIGKALAEKFASEGWKVAASARRKEILDKMSSHENIFSYPLDVTNQDQIKISFEKIIEDFKPKCPVCREEIKWLRKCSFLNETLICSKCKENIVDVYQYPCSHVIFCSKCYPSRSRSCSECEEDIEETRQINII